MAYDIKNATIVWRGIELTGFGDDHKYNITQNGDSFTPYKGVNGEGLNIVNNQRQWQITTSLKVDSNELPILIEDNLNRKEDTLVIRDLNTGISDTFEKCVVQGIGGEQDAGTRTINFAALTRNGK